MKKSDVFSLPQRQSKFAIIFIILRLVKNLFKQLWPFVIAIFIGRGNSSFDTLEIALSGVGIFGIIPSVISYYKFYFQLSEKELIINKGLFKKVKLNIPFERIQSVNFRQTFIHRFFKVTEVEIETAGSSEQETKIDAIEIPMAELLRKRILEKKEAVDLKGNEEIGILDIQQEKESILQLSQRELIKVGLVQNHFRPIGLMIGAFGSLFFYLYTFDYDPRDFFKQIYNYGEQLTVLNISALILLLIIASVVFSIITTVFRHFNLHFWRMGNKFQVVQGLLTRQEFAALDNKIQILNWGQNPFERLVGFYNIIFRQAKSGDEKKTVSQFKIPGCNLDHVSFVKEAWLGKDSGSFEEYHQVSHHYFFHKAMYQCLFFGGIIIGLIYFKMIIGPIVLGVLLALILWLSWINYRKKRFAVNDRELYIGGGTLGLRHALLPMYKVQDIKIIENPYQWRRGLATLIIHTAAGTIRIPYIPKETALDILDKLIYHVEISNKPWI